MNNSSISWVGGGGGMLTLGLNLINFEPLSIVPVALSKPAAGELNTMKNWYIPELTHWGCGDKSDVVAVGGRVPRALPQKIVNR